MGHFSVLRNNGSTDMAKSHIPFVLLYFVMHRSTRLANVDVVVRLRLYNIHRESWRLSLGHTKI